MKEQKLGELAILVGGKVIGDAKRRIGGASPIHNALSSDITFLENIDRLHLLQKSKAGAVVLARTVEEDVRIASLQCAVLLVDEVLPSFEKIALHFRPQTVQPVREIHPAATVAQSAKVGKNVLIDACAVIGENVEIAEGCTIHSGVRIFDNCQIGPDCTIYPNAVLYENSILGPRCIIHSCSVIGAYGFGYDSSKGIHRLSSQLGNVVLGADVEIGACSTIDRGTYGSTQIGDGTKIDNLVMIAHNCMLGKYNLICAHTGIAGSTTTGDYVIMAGRVGIRDHVHVGDQAILGAMSGVMSDVPEKARWVGIPATPEKEQMKKQAALARLPEMRKELKALQQQVQQLESHLSENRSEKPLEKK
ncbi:MAG: UDP-3-O-(3-hydroxymyristoyl)glucosamine N-acyltransferase [Thermoguttaceae bacterium]